jgi:K+/H+ antiporter YhaU regulatory subunit KhtT
VVDEEALGITRFPVQADREEVTHYSIAEEKVRSVKETTVVAVRADQLMGT